MGARGSLLRGRAIANGGAAGDEGRPVGVLRGFERLGNSVGVMAIDANDGPAVGGEALQLVGRIGKAELAVDRNIVVVPQQDQLGELQMAGQGCGLLGNASMRQPSPAIA